jgi:hypothetical protein
MINLYVKRLESEKPPILRLKEKTLYGLSNERLNLNVYLTIVQVRGLENAKNEICKPFISWENTATLWYR